MRGVAWARSIAVTAVSRKAEPSWPRRCGGAISPRYMGTTTVDAPHAMPVITRPAMRIESPPMHGSGRHRSALSQEGREEAASSKPAMT